MKLFLNQLTWEAIQDTIAAIVGGMAGTYYGFKYIHDNWVQNLAIKVA